MPLAAPAFANKILRGLGFGFRGFGLEFGVLGSKFWGWTLGCVFCVLVWGFFLVFGLGLFWFFFLVLGFWILSFLV